MFWSIAAGLGGTSCLGPAAMLQNIPKLHMLFFFQQGSLKSVQYDLLIKSPCGVTLILWPPFEELLYEGSAGATVWWSNSSVTAVIHTTRFVDNVNIRPQLQWESKYYYTVILAALFHRSVHSTQESIHMPVSYPIKPSVGQTFPWANLKVYAHCFTPRRHTALQSMG